MVLVRYNSLGLEPDYVEATHVPMVMCKLGFTDIICTNCTVEPVGDKIGQLNETTQKQVSDFCLLGRLLKFAEKYWFVN